MNEELEKALKQAEEIAKNGTGKEKKRYSIGKCSF